MIDVLLPGERDTLRGPLHRPRRRAAPAGGPQRRRQPLRRRRRRLHRRRRVRRGRATTNVDDIVNLQIKAAIRGSIDGEALPIGDVDPGEHRRGPVDARHGVRGGGGGHAPADGGPRGRPVVPQPALHGGRVGPRRGRHGDPRRGHRAGRRRHVPKQRSTPCSAPSSGSTLGAVLATLNPNEFQALQRYAPLFLDDLQDQLDALEGVSIAFPNRTYEVSGSGDTRDVTMTRLTARDHCRWRDSATIDLSNGCWTVESAGEQVDSCDTAGSMPSLDEVVDDPEQIEQLLQSLQAAFDDYDQPGLIVERVDRKWFVSPMATGSEQLLAVIRALSREEIEDLQEQVMDLSDWFGVVRQRGRGPGRWSTTRRRTDGKRSTGRRLSRRGCRRGSPRRRRRTTSAPRRTASTTTRAGWAGTSKRSYTRPGSSLIWGNVSRGGR